MPDLSDRVAIVALVVSLVAFVFSFIISVTQLLQAIASTAEGYRRCATEVVGPWSQLRRRRPKVWEGRAEVLYVTPHFTITSAAAELRTNAVRLSAPSSWTEYPDFKRRFIAALRETLDMPSSQTQFVDRQSTNRRIASWDVTEAISDAEKATQAAIGAVRGHIAPLSRKKQRLEDNRTHLPKNEVTVTWLALLKELHSTYEGYWFDDASEADRSNSEATDVTVHPREWSWDFMPPDLLRPLATSTLSDIILLGMRLNMNWRKLDLDNGLFLADGDGASLSSFEIRGLGTVFRFTEHDKGKSRARVLSPSKTADQLMFGIIPGDADLLGPEFSLHLVDNDRKVRGRPPRPILNVLGVEKEKVVDWAEKSKFQEPFNELVLLLCPFQSLRGCRFPFCFYSAWANRLGPLTPLHFFEGRVALVDELEALVENQPQRETLHAVLSEFRALRDDWAYDFLDRWGHSYIENKSARERSRLIDACREVFQRTTWYFQGRRETNTLSGSKLITGDYDWTQKDKHRRPYLDLVAGHYIAASAAVDYTSAKFDDLRGKYPPRIRAKHKEMVPWDNRAVSDHFQYSLARQYVRHSHEETDYKVVKHLRERGVVVDNKDEVLNQQKVEEAWWVLMLRGIVWDMATTGDARVHPDRSGLWQGDPVPSSFYALKFPVWIT